MKLKIIIVFSLVLYLLFSAFTKINAQEMSQYYSTQEEISNINSRAVEIDYSLIADNYNNSIYVSKLKELGINVKAVQNGTTIILTYNDNDNDTDNDTITFFFDSETNLLNTVYPLSNKKSNDILAAILVDTVSSMQGNEVGDQLPFYFNDGFCYSYYNTDGISKEYISSDSGASICCQIKTDLKMDVPSDISPINELTFTTDIDNLYSKNEYFTRENGLIFYKKYNEDGNLEIYIGQTRGFNENAYKSVLNFLSLLYEYKNFNSPKVLLYMKQNYTGLDKGNYEFDGVKIDTDIAEFPITTRDTILVGNSMKYAKFTIDENLLKDCSAKVSLVAQTNNSLNNSYKIKIAIILISILAILIIIKIIHKRKIANTL